MKFYDFLRMCVEKEKIESLKLNILGIYLT